MPDRPIREETFDEVLARVQTLGSLASETQIRSVLRVVAKSAVEVADPLTQAAKEIREFNDSTTHLTKQIITLNRRVLCATWVIAVATTVAALAAIVGLFCMS